MSIVIAEITKDGILLSADKRVGNNGIWKDNCIKAFAVGEKTAIGIVGKNINHPRTIKILLNKNLKMLKNMTVRDRAQTIAGIIISLNGPANTLFQMKLTVVGYDGLIPRIYQIEVRDNAVNSPKDRSPYIVSQDKIAYELTDHGLVALHQKDYRKETCDLALERHKRIICETSRHNETVSPTSNSYLITPNLIKRI